MPLCHKRRRRQIARHRIVNSVGDACAAFQLLQPILVLRRFKTLPRRFSAPTQRPAEQQNHGIHADHGDRVSAWARRRNQQDSGNVICEQRCCDNDIGAVRKHAISVEMRGKRITRTCVRGKQIASVGNHNNRHRHAFGKQWRYHESCNQHRHPNYAIYVGRRFVTNPIYGPYEHNQHDGNPDWMPQIRMQRAHTIPPRNVPSHGFRTHWTSPTMPLPDAKSYS